MKMLLALRIAERNLKGRKLAEFLRAVKQTEENPEWACGEVEELKKKYGLEGSLLDKKLREGEVARAFSKKLQLPLQKAAKV